MNSTCLTINPTMRLDELGSLVGSNQILQCQKGVGKFGVKMACKEEMLSESLEMVSFSDPKETRLQLVSCLHNLEICITTKAFAGGKQVHANIVKNPSLEAIFLDNKIISMYIKFSSVRDARKVFDVMAERNVFSWTIMLTAYTQDGDAKEALNLYRKMEDEGFKPDRVTVISILTLFSILKAFGQGKLIHARTSRTHYIDDISVRNTLINMYAKCRSMKDAHDAFDRMNAQDAVSWNVMISAYALDGNGKQGLKLFQKMQQEGLKPNKATFLSSLKACTVEIAIFEYGKYIHACILLVGYGSDVLMGSALIDMYAKCGSKEDVCKVFERMSISDTVLWNSIIAGLVHCADGKEALNFFQQMPSMKTDKVTYVSVLSACSDLQFIGHAKVIHAKILKSRLEADMIISNALVNMYAKCGSLEQACKIFAEMSSRDTISWNGIITAHSRYGHGHKALRFYLKMQQGGLQPNKVTYVTILSVCVSLSLLEQGKLVHASIIKDEFVSNMTIGNSLIDMYAICGNLESARNIFDRLLMKNVVSWTTMIAAYDHNANGAEAITLFFNMNQEAIEANEVTFVSVVSSCSGILALQKGKLVHAFILPTIYESDLFVANALVDMYAKCGSIMYACQVFCRMPRYDVISWNSLIGGYTQNGSAIDALSVYKKMQMEIVDTSDVTRVNVLAVCAATSSLQQGKKIHADILKGGNEIDSFLGSSLVDMYAKSGKMHHACDVFDRMLGRDIVSWNAMVAGYSQQGFAKEAIVIYNQMQQEGMKPNDISFSSILIACSHACLVHEGCHYFVSISQDHSITESVHNYGCIVDLLGRAGYVDSAQDLINAMPFQPRPLEWVSLMGACKVHQNIDIAEYALKNLCQLEAWNDAAFVLLSNIYALARIGLPVGQSLGSVGHDTKEGHDLRIY